MNMYILRKYELQTRQDYPLTQISTNHFAMSLSTHISAGYILPKKFGYNQKGKMHTVNEHKVAYKFKTALKDASNRSEYHTKYETLNLRERQVAVLIGEGVSNTRIGDHLHLSSEYVNELRSGMKSKLQFKTTLEFYNFLKWVGSYLNK